MYMHLFECIAYISIFIREGRDGGISSAGPWQLGGTESQRCHSDPHCHPRLEASLVFVLLFISGHEFNFFLIQICTYPYAE
jgi:hypothetical protein